MTRWRISIVASRTSFGLGAKALGSGGLQNMFDVCGTSIKCGSGAFSLVHYISGFFGGSSVWSSHTRKHWETGGFFFLYPTDNRGRAGPTLARVGYGHRTQLA